jgi:hypothetical protein
MVDQSRAHLALRLVGGQYRDGEIPLTDLASVADKTQKLVRRIARSTSDRAGPGRTPAHIEEPTTLLLIGIRPGSTVLEIAGPSAESQLDLGDVGDDIRTQALSIMVDGIEAVATGSELPDGFDDLSVRSLDEWLDSIAATAAVAELTAEVGTRPKRVLRVVPQEARAQLARRVAPAPLAAPPEQAVEGTLYAVNLRTGRYTIEDDLGNSIGTSASVFTSEEIAPLLGRRVRAEGMPRFDEAGRLQAIELTRLAAAPDTNDIDAERFFRNVELEELLQGAGPLRSMDELAIEGLATEEIDDFLRAIRE